MKHIPRFLLRILIFLASVTIILLAITISETRKTSSNPSAEGLQPYPSANNPTVSEAVIAEAKPVYPQPEIPQSTSISKSTQAAISIPTTLPSPTPPQSFLPLPTYNGLLPAGPKLVYAETDGVHGISRIWLANIGDLLNQRKLLATVQHKPGYGLNGKVSPDGNKIAYILVPPGSSERSARTDGNELWLLNSDGSHPYKLTDQIGYLGMWAPDSKSLIVGRWISAENNESPVSGLRQELFLVHTADSEMKLLITGEPSANLQPDGCSKDEQVFYYAVQTSFPPSWELWSVEIPSGSPHLQISRPFESNDIPVLSPDGKWLLVTKTESGQRALLVMSIDGQGQINIAQSTTSSGTADQLTGWWAADSQSILLYIPSENGKQPDFEVTGFDGKQKRKFQIADPILGKGEYLSLIGWSPDQDWAIVRQYPHRPQSTVFTIQMKDGKTVKFPIASPSNWLSLLGWINQ